MMDSQPFGSFDRPILSSKCSVNCDYDSLYEILLRVDPPNLFNCILVSKEWLSILSSQAFRTNYLSRWKNTAELVVGLLRYGGDRIPFKPREVQLYPTAILGRKIKMPDTRFGYYICKSPKGGLLLFAGVKLKTLFIWKLPSGGPPVELPPPACYYLSMANIISSDDGEEYKVILGKWDYEVNTYVYEVNIQTFCSRTWKWEKSVLTCSTPLHLCPCSLIEGGIVDRNGVIYWNAIKADYTYCFVAWDINGDGFIDVIQKPRPRYRVDSKTAKSLLFTITYDVSQHARGSLLAATNCSLYKDDSDYGWDSEWFTIDIWALDDKKDWNLVHSVRHESIWTNNLAMLECLFSVKPNTVFSFVSFVPGKPDFIYVRLNRQLFIYHFETGKLEYLEYLYGSEFGRSLDWDVFHPLTIMDLWPSPPPSLQLLHWF